MTKVKVLLVALPATLLLMVLSVAVLAQDEPSPEVPPPYAGLKNPFSWSDTSVQEAGKELYKRSCLGCHGVDGGNIPGSDFSAADSQQSLEERPDFFFWLLSEGMLDKGMPPYKSSLSEEQQWQVLTYLWFLGATAPPGPTPTEAPADREIATLLLTAPEEAMTGEPLTLTAVLEDSQGKPISNAAVRFFVKVDFFASDLMEIGQAATDTQGISVFEYTPRLTGDIEIVARYDGDGFAPTETASTLILAESDKPFYEVEAGIHLPSLGGEVFIGPQSALELGETNQAPTSAFRLPGGVLSWLLLFVIVVMTVWLAYSLVMYQVFRIATRSPTTDAEIRLLPVFGILVTIALGIMLALMVLVGPNSHLHLR